MKFKMREIIEKVSAAQLTRAYMVEGMHALRADNIKKPKKKGQKTDVRSMQLRGAKL
jgi:hypothetical protein